MKLNEWLNKEVGRSAKLAAHFNRTPGAISQWRKNGVPVNFMTSVRDFTDGEVTLEDMLPEKPDLTAKAVAHV